MSSERMLQMVLNHHREPVAKFPQVAFLPCCYGICHTRKCHTVNMPTAARDEKLALQGKYPSEIINAMRNGIALAHPGARFSHPIHTMTDSPNKTMIMLAFPRPMVAAIDCNLSTVEPASLSSALRVQDLPGSIRFYGPPQFCTESPGVPGAVPRLLLDLLGARATSLPLHNDSMMYPNGTNPSAFRRCNRPYACAMRLAQICGRACSGNLDALDAGGGGRWHFGGYRRGIDLF